jgi:hypothetical protein
MSKLKKVLDPRHAMEMASGYDLRVELKKGPKGTSLYARKPLKRGNVVAYYKFLLHKYRDNFRGKKSDMYVMSVYTKKDKFNPRVIGDIYEGSLDPPKYNIPFWAYFSNEPSGDQKENCTINSNLKYNYRKRNTVRPGDTMVYKLVATKDISPGEEIVWCYGENYVRKYEANCGG